MSGRIIFPPSSSLKKAARNTQVPTLELCIWFLITLNIYLRFDIFIQAKTLILVFWFTAPRDLACSQQQCRGTRASNLHPEHKDNVLFCNVRNDPTDRRCHNQKDHSLGFHYGENLRFHTLIFGFSAAERNFRPFKVVDLCSELCPFVQKLASLSGSNLTLKLTNKMQYGARSGAENFYQMAYCLRYN